MLKKTLFILILTPLYLFRPALAQVKKAKDSTTSTVIIFNSNTKEGIQKHGSSENNILKIEPFGFIAGKIPLSYERRITDLLSIQLSAGITMKNYTRSIFQTGLRDAGEITDKDEITIKNPNLPAGFNDETDPLYNYDHRKASLGYMFSFQPRLHFDDDGLEGSFLALSADFYKYNFTIPGLESENGEFKHTGSNKNEYEKIQDIMVFFGYQRLYDRLSLEYMAGVGIRHINGVKYLAGSSDAGFYETESEYSKKTGLNFSIGFKVGYHF